jgi:hypothetical protein
MGTGLLVGLLTVCFAKALDALVGYFKSARRLGWFISWLKSWKNQGNTA